MDKSPSQVLTESEIHALVDQQASPEKLAALRLRLALDPAGQATLEKWQRQRDALQSLHQQVLAEPIPKTLRVAAQQSFAARQEIDQWWRWGGMATGVMLAFGVGWFSHTALNDEAQIGSASSTLARARITSEFVHQAGLAHAVYAPVPSFYWIDQGFGYALAGPVPREELMKLAEAVYRQL